MASIFTYQEEPHKVHSPWSTPGSSTPQIAVHVQSDVGSHRAVEETMITKLEPEKHDGPIEYKLHLLLRWRRTFTYSSTVSPNWVPQQNKPDQFSISASNSVDAVHPRATYQPSSQNRQARLQQLTTQLLWRLQQSSPFHSSSNAKLVLPILPEATPRLGVPDRPSKLLPGLEESQGALYEIGVADDGTLVGLADEELEESLTNLRSMAASLGCVVDVHRRVIVGDCEWLENDPVDQTEIIRTSKLWVAEVLVRPDNKNIEIVPASNKTALQTLDLNGDLLHLSGIQQEISKEYLRVVLVGATAAGKSSLLGTLTTSILDNGRGKSRISLLKHRHEISSGITSSVAQELLGYDRAPSTDTPVINYATGDVSSWPDIHNLADRLVFLSDSPGLPRYSKSAFRALISWKPSWAVLCIPADGQPHTVASIPAATTGTPPPIPSIAAVEESNLSLAYLELCLKVKQPFIVAITKMDLATKGSLRHVLGNVLSAVKSAGRTPALINATNAQGPRKDDVEFAAKVGTLVTGEQDIIERELAALLSRGSAACVPIVMTSAVSGLGIPSIHAILRSLPLSTDASAGSESMSGARTIFRTDEVFAIPPSKVYSTSCERISTDSGVVLCGLMDAGTIALGDTLLLGPFLPEQDNEETLGRLTPRRASSYHNKAQLQSLPRSLSETFAKSLHLNGSSHHHLTTEQDAEAAFIKVHVVSLRNLRLPVTALRAGDTGTVGIQLLEPGESHIALNKARKGMVLTQNFEDQYPKGYRSFCAYFPYSDFGTSASPPLILGGHAIVYINSVRAAVKVTAVALSDPEDRKKANEGRNISQHEELFSFEDEYENTVEKEETTNGAGSSRRVSDSDGYERQDVKITFRFVSTVEFLEVNDQVLVVPNLIAAGPVAGPVANASISGLSGFVGRISEVYL